MDETGLWTLRAVALELATFPRDSSEDPFMLFTQIRPRDYTTLIRNNGFLVRSQDFRLNRDCVSCFSHGLCRSSTTARKAPQEVIPVRGCAYIHSDRATSTNGSPKLSRQMMHSIVCSMSADESKARHSLAYCIWMFSAAFRMSVHRHNDTHTHTHTKTNAQRHAHANT